MQPKIAETRQVSFQRIICTIQLYDFLVTRTVSVFLSLRKTKTVADHDQSRLLRFSSKIQG